MAETSNRTDEPVLGRPRSESARRAVLNAVDDMLVEHGYAALTLKGIAEQAGVGRQTIYRWWSTKAEILHEACVQDAATELAVPLTANPVAVVSNYLAAVVQFLTQSAAGAAYRALLGEAQHDSAVAELLRGEDALVTSAVPVIAHVLGDGTVPGAVVDEELVADLLGPTVFPILTGAKASTKAQLRERASRFVDRCRS